MYRLPRRILARAGATAFALALVPHWALGGAAAPGAVAGLADGAIVSAAVIAAGSHFEMTPDLPPGLVPPELRVPPMPRARALSVEARPALPPPDPLVRDGFVIASWYGPGFYGNRTACGQLYTPEIAGVAHRTLPCGTLIAITSPRGVTLTVAVIDRGPFIAGRALDLSNATRAALQCSDLCRVHMRVLD